MDFRPLHDRVLVKRIEESETMRGGLYIPDSAKEKPQQGEVIAVGKGKRTDKGDLIPLEVAVGDRILFGKYSGSDVPKLDDNEYLIMREDEVLGVFSNGASSAKGGK
jgi:chaperonin GroES